MTAREKKFLCLSTVIAAVLCVPGAAFAMHIMEGYLPPAYCVAWGALCLPFLAAGVISIRRLTREHRKSLLLLAMATAVAGIWAAVPIGWLLADATGVGYYLRRRARLIGPDAA